MRDLSIFIDESGDKTAHARYFILTLVIHDQRSGIAEQVAIYERSLALADSPNIPFHSEPLLNGHGDYEGLPLQQRKAMLSSFAAMVRYLPIRYKAFVYPRRYASDIDGLISQMESDLVVFFSDHLDYFQAFQKVKIYYDNGQELVKRALHDAVERTLSKQAIIRKRMTMTEYRLAQVADYLCTIELAATKYAAGENGRTYDKFFGSVGKFKKNWLKQARRKLMGD